MWSSDNEYEPSEVPFQDFLLEQAILREQPHRAAAERSRPEGRTAKQFMCGGGIDSQTSDTQFLDALGEQETVSEEPDVSEVEYVSVGVQATMLSGMPHANTWPHAFVHSNMSCRSLDYNAVRTCSCMRALDAAQEELSQMRAALRAQEERMHVVQRFLGEPTRMSIDPHERRSESEHIREWVSDSGQSNVSREGYGVVTDTGNRRGVKRTRAS
ncbi:hypothetical protein BV20DRAFT_344603 [Pilatotrama ljubarskyi]|nr:hypothetical protein BV20DRAFT_344603 [Pilatotrama ljubarskyi]